MLTGTMSSELIGNARIWTLTVTAMPEPGDLIEWDEPELGSIPARTGVRGWVSSKPSTYPGTVLVTVAAESTRWVVINVVKRSAGFHGSIENSHLSDKIKAALLGYESKIRCGEIQFDESGHVIYTEQEFSIMARVWAHRYTDRHGFAAELHAMTPDQADAFSAHAEHFKSLV